MSQRDPRPRLADILEALAGIEETIEGVSFERYQHVWHIRRAVERGIEIISEASRHISAALKAQHPDIPWGDIASMGNKLRHEYGRIDDEIIWKVTQVDLPPLKRAVEAMIMQLQRPESTDS
jgi:uncharacterized protein with HEPN domain